MSFLTQCVVALQHLCERGPRITMKTLTEETQRIRFAWGVKERNENKADRERERGERRQSAHLEHDPVLFLRLLNHTHVAPHCDFWHGAGLCRFTTAPGLTTSYTGTLSNKVFVCGSGRAPPSFAGVVVYYTASPQSNTQHIPARGRIYSLYGCVTVLLLLAHNSSDIIQRKLQCGDSFRAARMNVCFCLHCRHTHTKKNLGSGEKMCLRVLLVCACVIKLDEADKSMLILWLVERDHTVCLLHPALFAL